MVKQCEWPWGTERDPLLTVSKKTGNPVLPLTGATRWACNTSVQKERQPNWHTDGRHGNPGQRTQISHAQIPEAQERWENESILFYSTLWQFFFTAIENKYSGYLWNWQMRFWPVYQYGHTCVGVRYSDHFVSQSTAGLSGHSEADHCTYIQDTDKSVIDNGV